MAGDAPFVVELAGRMGNQLFSYGFGQALARRTGSRVVYLDRYRDPTHYVLPQLLRTPPPLASPDDKRQIGLVEGLGPRARVTRGLQRVEIGGRTLLPPFRMVEERSLFTFDPQILEAEAPTLLRGYFQHESYLDGAETQLLDELDLPDIGLPGQLTDRTGDTVAVHFRRGDYLGVGWTLPLAYYERALDTVDRHCDIGAVVVIGDDPDFVKLAVHYFGPRFGCVVDAYEICSTPIEHLTLLSRCDHCVVSNSTLAWWGAWIGDQRHPAPDRLIVAPSRWHPEGTAVRAQWTVVEA